MGFRSPRRPTSVERASGSTGRQPDRQERPPGSRIADSGSAPAIRGRVAGPKVKPPDRGSLAAASSGKSVHARTTRAPRKSHSVQVQPLTSSEPAGAPSRFLRQSEVCERVGVSRSTLWRMESRGEFLPSVQISPGCVGWLESDVDDWIEDRRSRPKTPRGNRRGRDDQQMPLPFPRKK